MAHSRKNSGNGVLNLMLHILNSVAPGYSQVRFKEIKQFIWLVWKSFIESLCQFTILFHHFLGFLFTIIAPMRSENWGAKYLRKEIRNDIYIFLVLKRSNWLNSMSIKLLGGRHYWNWNINLLISLFWYLEWYKNFYWYQSWFETVLVSISYFLYKNMKLILI